MLWLKGRYPREPEKWREEVRDAEKRASKWARGKLRTSEEKAFPPLWSRREFKVRFSRAQSLKCGYCELSLAAEARGGDMDHYRPKAAIRKLLDDPATWGDETPGHTSRDPKKPRLPVPACSGKGYFWLAYDWRNYVLSCSNCNEKWKGNLFPIEGGHLRAPTRKSWTSEKPLLLNPYGDNNPADHLEFDKIGLIVPWKNSPFGFETIRTCHLGRETLRSQRHDVAKRAWPFIKRIVAELGRSLWNERRLRRAIVDLLKLGAVKKPHAGMVRILWAQQNRYGISWRQLRELRDTLLSSRT